MRPGWWKITHPDWTDFDRPQGVRTVDDGIHKPAAHRLGRCEDGALTVAPVSAYQAVIAAGLGTAVAHTALRAVIQKQGKRYRRRLRSHSRERTRVGKAMKLLFPGVIATQQSSRCGRPTDVSIDSPGWTPVNAGVGRRWRCVAFEDAIDIAR